MYIRLDLLSILLKSLPTSLIFICLIYQFLRELKSSTIIPFNGLYYYLFIFWDCPSPTPRACSNSCPLSQWCHPIISSSVIPFSSWLHSFPASGSFLMSQLFTSGGQSIGVSASASVFLMNIQDWFPLGWTGLISLQSKGLSWLLSNTTVQKHQIIATQLCL